MAEEDRREVEGKVPCSPQVHMDKLEEDFNQLATQILSTF